MVGIDPTISAEAGDSASSCMRFSGPRRRGPGMMLGAEPAFYAFAALARSIASTMSCLALVASPQPISLTHLPGSRSL